MACCGSTSGGTSTLSIGRAHSLINTIHDTLERAKAGKTTCRSAKDRVKQVLAVLDQSFDPAFSSVRYAKMECAPGNKIFFAYSAMHRMTTNEDTSSKQRLLLSFMIVQQGNNLIVHAPNPIKYAGTYNPTLTVPGGYGPADPAVLQVTGTSCPGQCVPGALGQNRCPPGMAGSGLGGGCGCGEGSDLAASLECNAQPGLDFC